MTGLSKLRNFGVLLVVVVAAAAMGLEASLRNGVFIAAVAVLAVGWIMLCGMVDGGETVTTVKQPASAADATALSATGKTLSQCSTEFGSQFNLTRDELGRAQQIFSDAIGNLVASFNSMSEQARRQQELGVEIVRQHGGADAGGSDFERFAKQTSETLRTFVDSVIENSKLAMELVEMTERIANEMRQILGMLGELKAVTDELGSAGQSAERAALDADAIDRMKSQLERAVSMLEGITHVTENNPVKQEGFASGGVELF